MSRLIFSRAYLQSLPLERKREEVDTLIRQFAPSIRNTAREGYTYYLFDMTNMRLVKPIPEHKRVCVLQSPQNTYTIPNEELVTLFQEKFPDCTVTYQEIWTETETNERTVKKGILIDWS